jgi:glycosyltransferase involved in cell wall biosynthesis
MPPDITVIIPFLNRAASVVAAAQSALSQQGPTLELIAVDDGSADDGAARLQALGDPRLSIIRHARNRGAAAARNTGIAAATAPKVAFLDSDDVFLPGKLAAQAALMARDNLDLCFSGFVLLGASRRVVRLDTPAQGWAKNFLDGCFVSPGSTQMATRDALHRIGPLDETLRRFEDWDFLLRAARQGARFGAVPEPLAEIPPGPHPRPAALEAALATLAERHGSALEGAARRRFLASLALERAVARRRAGDTFGALVAALPALASPGRVAALARRLVANRHAKP